MKVSKKILLLKVMTNHKVQNNYVQFSFTLYVWGPVVPGSPTFKKYKQYA